MHNAKMIEKKQKQAALLLFMSTLVIFSWGRGKAGMVAKNVMHHVVGFCNCFLYFKTEFKIH
jgi:hypothetical protein